MPKKKTTAKKSNKSAFIRNFPAETSAAEIVAKAKAAGLKLSPAFVYAVRSKAKNGEAKPSTGPGRKVSNGQMSASDFVRTQPDTMKAADVVAAGAQQGLTFSANLVYMVRSKSGKAPTGRRGRPRLTTNGASANGGMDASFRKLAIDLGIGRARALLDGLERRIAEIIG